MKRGTAETGIDPETECRCPETEGLGMSEVRSGSRQKQAGVKPEPPASGGAIAAHGNQDIQSVRRHSGRAGESSPDRFCEVAAAMFTSDFHHCHLFLI